MFSFPFLCYYVYRPFRVRFLLGVATDMAIDRPQETQPIESDILVIGQRSSLVEGVADLLQLAGYRVETSSSWAETERTRPMPLPDLVIVDVPSAADDANYLSEQMHKAYWANTPILVVSFSGDDWIRVLQQDHSVGGSVHFYAHTLLSIDSLLDTVKHCLAA
jgi:DNA-binding NtrC family response regulator